MGSAPDSPITDPLLRPESGPRDALGKPVRAPLGNSIRTFLIFAVLIVVGAAIWWVLRPDDLSASIGGREWTITDVDGEPATNQVGLASTFVLDGNGEIRGPVACNVASGAWVYDEQRSELSIDWQTQTTLTCPEDWPQTYLPDGGQVAIDGAVMRITTDMGEVRAVSLADHSPAEFEEIAGTWTSGGTTIEIGQRGRFEVGECEGSWEADATAEAETTMAVSFDELEQSDCGLAAVWKDETPLVPVRDDGIVYLRRDRGIYPIDRSIIRLDPQP
jgi:hypothetical protein